jgi:hypothetical protein
MFASLIVTAGPDRSRTFSLAPGQTLQMLADLQRVGTFTGVSV